MGQKRQAIDTIRGYFYQFDKTILVILNQDEENKEITIEGIEDIDVENIANSKLAIQCKYHSKQTYNHSEIKKPIILMLKHFSNNPNQKLKYYLYANFKNGQYKLPDNFSLDFLKDNFLTYKKCGKVHKTYKEMSLTDKQLETFMKNLKIDINAISFNEQEKKIKTLLKQNINCADNILELYYSKAGSIIKELSIKQQRKDRIITKKQFIDQLKNVNNILDDWYILKVGFEKYYRFMRNKYFTQKNINPYERFFIIEYDDNMNDGELKNIIEKLSRNWSKITQREQNCYCPYIIFENLPHDILIKLKKSLQHDDFNFIDGFDFKNADFSIKSVIRKVDHCNKIKAKFITLEKIDLVLEKIDKTKEIYQFYLKNPFYKNTKHTHIEIKIKETKDILDII